MADEAMIPGRAYWLKLGTQSVSATVQAPKNEINVNTLDHLATKTLDLNGIRVAGVSTDKPSGLGAYAANRRPAAVFGRHSVVSGKRVSVRGDTGGRRIINNSKH